MANKSETFLARVEKLVKSGIDNKEGPEADRLRIAIREGLMTPERRRGRGGRLESALHSMDLVRINVTGRGPNIEENLSVGPESAMVYLAFAAEHIERIIDAVSAELDICERENAARRQRKIRRAA